MTRNKLRQLRNIGIAAHIDAGKTTLTERILYFTGKIHKIGETHDGQSQMDTQKLEAEKGITISSAATQTAWKYEDAEYKMNIIDTPGHVDFTIEVERSLRVLDGMVFLFDSVAGVEPQSETVWQQAERYEVPLIAFVNKMDRTGANFLKVVKGLRARLNANAVPIQLPYEENEVFIGVIDLLKMKLLTWNEDGNEMTESNIPEAKLEEAQIYRGQLLEALADVNDDMMALFFEDENAITEEQILSALRQAVLQRSIVPVLLGTAYKNKGIQPLLNAVCQYLPAPTDLKATEGTVPDSDTIITRQANTEEPFAALAFKLALDEQNRQLTFFRVYSGTLKLGESILNTRTGKKSRIARLYQMHANKKSELKEVSAGDIAATTGLSDFRTGDTLSALNAPIVLEQLFIPEPVISMSIEAKESAKVDKLGMALAKLQHEDPTFRVKMDEATGQTVIYGMGELHLEIITRKLAEDFKIPVHVGKPRVAFMEALSNTIRHRERLKKQTGGAGLFAEIDVEMGPADADWLAEQKNGERLQFVDEVVGGAIPKPLISSVEKGFKRVLENGPLEGYPLESLKVRLLDGSTHVNDSKPIAFELVAVDAFKEVVQQLNPQILEPIMKVQVKTPADYIGTIMGGINRRRGMVKNQTLSVDLVTIEADIPLSELFGYIGHLRSVSAGRASFSMVLSHYAKAVLEVS